MTPLDQKINQHFQGLVVRKDLVKTVKGNAIVPYFPALRDERCLYLRQSRAKQGLILPGSPCRNDNPS